MARIASTSLLFLALLMPSGGVMLAQEDGDGEPEAPPRLDERVTILEGLPVARRVLPDAGPLLHTGATNMDPDGRVDPGRDGVLSYFLDTSDGLRIVTFGRGTPEGVVRDPPLENDALEPIDEERLLDSPELVEEMEGRVRFGVSFIPSRHDHPVATMMTGRGSEVRRVDAYTGEPLDAAAGR